MPTDTRLNHKSQARCQTCRAFVRRGAALCKRCDVKVLRTTVASLVPAVDTRRSAPTPSLAPYVPTPRDPLDAYPAPSRRRTVSTYAPRGYLGDGEWTWDPIGLRQLKVGLVGLFVLVGLAFTLGALL